VIQVPMKDPDEAIGEGTKSLMMGLAAVPQHAVVVVRTGGARQGGRTPIGDRQRRAADCGPGGLGPPGVCQTPW
jgi:hypothetical protein